MTKFLDKAADWIMNVFLFVFICGVIGGAGKMVLEEPKMGYLIAGVVIIGWAAVRTRQAEERAKKVKRKKK